MTFMIWGAPMAMILRTASVEGWTPSIEAFIVAGDRFIAAMKPLLRDGDRCLFSIEAPSAAGKG